MLLFVLKRLRFLLLILLYFGCQSITTPIAVAAIFSDHMVLQQQMEVPVWGSGSPGATITI